MGNILSRIQEIAGKEGITIGALERVIGASKGVLSRAINNGTDIQSKWLGLLVENYPLYSTRWLLTGEGSMLRNEQAQPTPPPVVQADSSGEAAIYYKMYKEEKAEKEAKVEVLTGKMLQMAEELGNLKAKLSQYEPEAEVPSKKTKGLGHAKTVSTEKPSSLNADNATSAIAQ